MCIRDSVLRLHEHRALNLRTEGFTARQHEDGYEGENDDRHNEERISAHRNSTFGFGHTVTFLSRTLSACFVSSSNSCMSAQLVPKSPDVSTGTLNPLGVWVMFATMK